MSLSPGHLLVRPWVSGHRHNQIWNNQSDQRILNLTESILTMIIILCELNQKHMWLSNHRTLKGPSRSHHFLSAEDTAYNAPTFSTPQPQAPFSRLIESLKGLHWPQHTLQLKWPFASLTCSGLQHQAFHLVSGTRPVICVQPSLGLNCGEEERKQSREWAQGKRKETIQGRRKATKLRKGGGNWRGGLLSCRSLV